jgi:hypothetical protein
VIVLDDLASAAIAPGESDQFTLRTGPTSFVPDEQRPGYASAATIPMRIRFL